jgi:hypothetical protein
MFQSIRFAFASLGIYLLNASHRTQEIEVLSVVEKSTTKTTKGGWCPSGLYQNCRRWGERFTAYRKGSGQCLDLIRFDKSLYSKLALGQLSRDFQNQRPSYALVELVSYVHPLANLGLRA